jgi:2-dehydropantoate 2-reductase
MSQVAVIGPGALGCLFTLRLMKAGTEVFLVDHRPERRALLQEQGISLETGDMLESARPRMTDTVPPGMDLVLVLTKARAIEELVLPPHSPVLTLQNGLGIVERLTALSGSRWLLAGITTEAATLLGPGRARHSAPGITAFGPVDVCPADGALDLLTRAGFETVLLQNPEEQLWQKAVLSAAINPLTALLRVPNGKLLVGRESRRFFHHLLEEALSVAQASGFCKEFDALAEGEALCRRSERNLSSMYQDILHERETEIEVLSGAILEKGRALSLPLPVTTMVYRLIRSLEERWS